MKVYRCIALLAFVLLMACASHKGTSESESYPFRIDNLIPWSIVGFDAMERTPEQRIAMLQKSGYKQYAYGNRPKHIPTMKHEWELAKEKGVKINAVWLYINLKKDKVGKLKPESEVVFENLEAVGLETQIWVGMDPSYFDDLTDKESLNQATEMIAYLSERAKNVNCKIALYNHGGWFGKPDHQIRIIESLPNDDLGIVYNFHHAHDDLDNYNKNIAKIMPYLWCINLNGMKKDGPKIISIGKGDLEKEMIHSVLDIGYKGPFGILGHVKGGDPKIILKENLTGLQELFPN